MLFISDSVWEFAFRNVHKTISRWRVMASLRIVVGQKIYLERHESAELGTALPASCCIRAYLQVGNPTLRSSKLSIVSTTNQLIRRDFHPKAAEHLAHYYNVFKSTKTEQCGYLPPLNWHLYHCTAITVASTSSMPISH